MKRILIFSLAYYPHVGGAEVALKEITDRISDIEFHMVTLRFAGEPMEEKIGNVMVHRVGSGSGYFSKMLFSWKAAGEARRLYEEQPFDAFWAMMSYMLLPVALLSGRDITPPYVLTLQEGDTFGHMFRRPHILPFIPMLQWGFAHASAVTALSSYLGQWARKMGYEGEIHIVPNGADLTKFVRTAHPAVATAQTVNLITSSRLVHKNGLDDVIRALVQLPNNVQFVIYGTGPLEKKLRDLAHELKVEERVLFKGFAPHEELARAFATAHIFIRPSRTEGFGASFVEAMAAGLPVIATQEGGIKDFLFDEKRNPEQKPTGWAVDVDSPEQIAQAVKDIMTNPDKVKRVTDNALAMVKEKYDWNGIAKHMRQLFDSLAK